MSDVMRPVDGHRSELLLARIERSKAIVRWLVSSGALVKFRKEIRPIMVASHIQLAMEHHAAVVALAADGHRASLLALIRPLYEAYVWCAWMQNCATDGQLVSLAEDKLSRGLEKRVRDLDRTGFFDRPMLIDMKPHINRMDGFVHGGFEHLRHRIQSDAVRANYPDDLIIGALELADLFAIMSLLEGPAIEPDIELGDRLDREARELLGLSPPSISRTALNDPRTP